MDISQDDIQILNNLLKTDGKAYTIYDNGQWVDTNCLMWSIPDVPEDELDVLHQYSKLMNIMIQLHQKNPDDPEIEKVNDLLKELLKRYKPIKKFGNYWLTPQDLLQNDPRKGINPYWWKARELLKGHPVNVFIGYSPHSLIKSNPEFDILIVQPSNDPYDFLRVHNTNGANWGYQTDQIIEKLKELDHQYSIDIVSASFDFVEFIFKRKLTRQEITILRKWILEFCPSTIEDVRKNLMIGKVDLWWD